MGHAGSVGATSEGGVPGRGGPSRGRADAELTWGDETPGRTDEFAPERLPDARALDPDSTAIVGVAAGTPNVAPVAGPAGATEVGASSGRGAWKRRLAPRHREAVQGFFGGSEKER